jgi:GcrA cell cycle regulator
MQSQRYLPRIPGESSLSNEISLAAANSGDCYHTRQDWGRIPPEYKTNWTSERTALLIRLWKDGVSAGLIARKLGQVTRSAVIGKVHRLGLSGRSTIKQLPTCNGFLKKPSRPIKIPNPPKVAFVKPTPPKPRVVAILFDAPEPRMLPLEALRDNECHFPIGDPLKGGFGFCGHPKERGAYCAAHGAIAYRIPEKRRRK